MHGRGVRQCAEEAFKWYVSHHVFSLFDFCMAHLIIIFTSRLVFQEYSSAACRRYLRAAERGHRSSQLQVSRSFANGGRGAARDPVAAERWAKAAAGK
jgi:TPR repeat protein